AESRPHARCAGDARRRARARCSGPPGDGRRARDAAAPAPPAGRRGRHAAGRAPRTPSHRGARFPVAGVAEPGRSGVGAALQYHRAPRTPRRRAQDSARPSLPRPASGLAWGCAMPSPRAPGLALALAVGLALPAVAVELPVAVTETPDRVCLRVSVPDA